MSWIANTSMARRTMNSMQYYPLQFRDLVSVWQSCMEYGVVFARFPGSESNFRCPAILLFHTCMLRCRQVQAHLIMASSHLAFTQSKRTSKIDWPASH